MKFCKSLRRMMDISDPEWVPYYTNYKMLKKLVKGLHPTAPKTVPRIDDEYVDIVVTDNKNPTITTATTSFKVAVETCITPTSQHNVAHEGESQDQFEGSNTSYAGKTSSSRSTHPAILTYPSRMNSYAPRKLPLTQRQTSDVKETNTVSIASPNEEQPPLPPPSRHTTVTTNTNNIQQDSGDHSTEQEQKQRGHNIETSDNEDDDYKTELSSSKVEVDTVGDTNVTSSGKSPLHKKQCCKVPQDIATKSSNVQNVNVDRDNVSTNRNTTEANMSNNIPAESAKPQPHENPKCLVVPSTKDLIRNNVSEQQFFRCLHDEVHKVSYFYNAMIQELFLRYQLIQTTISTQIEGNNLIKRSVSGTVPQKKEAVAESSSSTTSTALDRPKIKYGIQYLLSRSAEEANDSKRFAKSSSTQQLGQSEPRWKKNLLSNDTDSGRQNVGLKNQVIRTETELKNDQQHLLSMSISIYKLSRDLLLLESYCIMALTSFSKILKKHDKVTGYETKNDFMTKIVIPSNFVQTHRQSKQKPRINPSMSTLEQSSDHFSLDDPRRRYVAQKKTKVPKGYVPATAAIPSLESMIDQCYTWYDTISNLLDENVSDISNQNRRSSLDQDECLFLDMIQKLRNQIYR